MPARDGPQLHGGRGQGRCLRAQGRHGAEAAPRAAILNWVRRCAERWAHGHFVLEQETNAYAVLPETQWRRWALKGELLPVVSA